MITFPILSNNGACLIDLDLSIFMLGPDRQAGNWNLHTRGKTTKASLPPPAAAWHQERIFVGFYLGQCVRVVRQTEGGEKGKEKEADK